MLHKKNLLATNVFTLKQSVHAVAVFRNMDYDPDKACQQGGWQPCIVLGKECSATLHSSELRMLTYIFEPAFLPTLSSFKRGDDTLKHTFIMIFLTYIYILNFIN